jgi:hypothetical protein
VLPSGRATVCELTLENGFAVYGVSYVLRKEDFVQSIGEEISYNNALTEVWKLEAYLAKEEHWKAEEDLNRVMLKTQQKNSSEASE